MAIKLICIDLDGTLLCRDHVSVCAKNIRAVRAALAAGIAVAPATGRILSRLQAPLAQLPQLPYAILCNGAEVVSLPTGAVLGGVSFLPQQALVLLRAAQQAGVPAMVYQGEKMLISPADLAALSALPDQTAHMAELLRLQQVTPDFAARFAALPDRIVKINLPVVTPAQRETLLKLIALLDWVEPTSSLPDNLELGPAGATKGAGVRLLCQTLGLRPDEVMAIGDGENDLSMFEFAGLSVAMANGCEKAKRTARFLTDTNENGGVAKAIFSVLKGV